MIKEALKYIIDLNKPEIIKVDGKEYSDKILYQVEPEIYRPDALHISTLSAFIDYIRDNKDYLKYEDLIIHIKSHNEIELMSKLDYKAERNCYLKCSAADSHFRFGSFYDAESFNIALQSMFCDAGNRADILKITGRVRAEGVQTTGDDGITQSVVTKQGIVLGDTTNIPNPVLIAPYRTFVEVSQPISQFVFRARGEEGMPMFALFEADGGVWKLTAVQRIKDYIVNALDDNGIEGISVIA
jgi:hypothetical protein